MKSYNVKSNAKRSARGLASRFPGYVAEEPVETAPGSGEWFPHVAAPKTTIADGVPEEISATAYVNGAVHGAKPEPAPEVRTDYIDPELAATMEERAARIAANRKAGAQKAAETRAAATTGAEVRKTTRTKRAEATAAAAADLPPPVKSTPEEIAARRAERRARIDRDKAEGKPVKSTKADLIVGLCSRPGGATVPELMEATGWQRHTLRGFIAGTLRKAGHDVESRRTKGEETRYLIPAEAGE